MPFNILGFWPTQAVEVSPLPISQLFRASRQQRRSLDDISGMPFAMGQGDLKGVLASHALPSRGRLSGKRLLGSDGTFLRIFGFADRLVLCQG